MVVLSNTRDNHGHNHRKTKVDPINEQKKKNIAFAVFYKYKNVILTSLSDVPQIEQHLHSMHCQRYFPTEMIIFAVNWRHVGWPIKHEK